MTRNPYDDPIFFAGYARLPRSQQGLAGAPEWPVLQSLLPDLRGTAVLDLGCGYGWFCRKARELGASSVLGMDISRRMLEKAEELTNDPLIRLQQADLESVELPPEAFELVFSSLALHYVADLSRLLGEISRTLVPGGWFVFSAEHPIYTAPLCQAWTVDGHGNRSWPVNHYQDEGRRSTDWIISGVEKQHRKLDTIINLLADKGFGIKRLVEWGPSPEQILRQPELAEERDRPMFFLLKACRI